MFPSGRARTLFIKEMMKLLLWWVDVTAMCDIDFPGIMIIPNLLLQKPKQFKRSLNHFRKTYRSMEEMPFYRFI